MEWQTALLDDLCEFKNGLWKGKKEPFVHVGVIRNANFARGGVLDDSDIAYLEVEKKQYETRKLEFGDLILEKSGGGPKQAVGRVIAFEKNVGGFSFSNFTSIVRIKDKTRLHYSFLHKFLHFLYETGATETMQRQSTGIRNLQLKEYKLIDVPIPPIPEQQRIVAILDQALASIEKARANAEQNLRNARELFDSYLQQVFSQRGEGWVEMTLGNTCTFQGGSQPPKSDFSDQQKEGYVRLIQIRDYKSEKRAVYIPLEKSKRYCMPDDVMIGRYGPPLFQILRGIEGSYNVALIKASPDESLVTKDFLYYFLKNKDILNYIINASNRAAGQIGLNKKTLEPYPISFPSIEKQQEIVAEIECLRSNIASLEAIYKIKVSNLDELKKSLLQKAFSGKLTKSKGIAA